MTQNSPSPPLAEVHRPECGVAVVTLLGEHDCANASDLQATLENVLVTSSKLVVDMSACEFIDSTVIRTLVIVRRQAEQIGVEFTLVVDRSSIVWRALDMLALGVPLHVVGSIEDALPKARPARRQTSSSRAGHHQGRHASA